MEELIKFFDNKTRLSEKDASFLRDELKSKTFKSEEYLLKEGQVSREFFFIVKGCVRLFYLVDGEEKTAFFYQENDFVSSYKSFTKELPSTHFIQSCEYTEVVSISFESAGRILAYDPKFSFLAQELMELELSILQEIISNFVALNAENRYVKMLNEQPKLIERIPQYHLATYLGVRPETLSRIRSKIKK